ncbi:MAG: metallophosphoesterase [Methanomassiliicoccales archaeon]|jgi:hypothetical protein
MRRKNAWKDNELLTFLKMRREGKSDGEVAGYLKKSAASVAAKSRRIDWDDFKTDPAKYLQEDTGFKRWGHDEMIRMDAYLQAQKSYSFIAEQLGRSFISVERKAQTTDWQAWRAMIGKSQLVNEKSQIINGKPLIENKGIDTERLVDGLLELSRNDFRRLREITKEKFCDKTNCDDESMTVTFPELQKLAKDRLNTMGYGNPEDMECGQGTYIIVGDSHGKHTKSEMFDLMEQIQKYFTPKKIIHVGHILDDDNDISYNWGKLDNVVIVAKEEELRIIQEQRKKFDFHYEVVRGTIALGKIDVRNQELIADYVAKSIGGLDPSLFPNRVIVNCHRHEFHTRCSNGDKAFVASPGCICEPHIIRTIKQINVKDKVIKQANYEGYKTYRRNKTLNEYWNQGLLVVHVAKDGFATVVPCVICKTSKGYTTSYGDKIISAKGIFKPTAKIFVNADIHSTKHDTKVLDIQDQIVGDYRPDYFVNVGDSHSFDALNHHMIDRGIPINRNLLADAAQTHHILRNMSKWAPKRYTIFGNHERFASDFAQKFPQLGEVIAFPFLCNITDLGYNLTPLKDVLEIGPTKFIHGDVKMYGQAGTKMEKVSRTYGRNVFIGHMHSPAIRHGCYSVGLAGQMDQEYNEPHASNWLHGFGMCNQFDGVDFPTTIVIEDYRCLINGKTYTPKHPKLWDMTSYKAKLVYEVN